MEAISVTGLDKALKLCKQAPRALESELRTSLRSGANRVLELARQQAPKRTGHLAASGRLVVSETGVSVVFGGSQAPYAGYRSYARRHGHHPDPFLQRAAVASLPLVTRTIDQGTQRLIERLARG